MLTGEGVDKMESGKRTFSGIQPTGRAHLGNYLGAICHWVRDQELYDGVYCVVDLHALTIPESVDTRLLRAASREAIALLIACGLDPNKTVLFIQSHVSAHSELAWILNCVTPISWLERMTQYKTRSSQLKSVGTGVLDYPVLQAADILLYDTTSVPVGGDQKQHVELARDIAIRFNNLFGQTFVIPEPHIPDTGARIMGLDDPLVKMSKSVANRSPGHAIGILDEPDTIYRSIMRAVTDSESEVNVVTACPGVLNLLTIYEALSGESSDSVSSRFQGQRYSYLKKQVAELTIRKLEPVRRRFTEVVSDQRYLDQIIGQGASSAVKMSDRVLSRVRDHIGVGSASAVSS